MHFDNDLWLPVYGENSVGNSRGNENDAYRNFQKQSGRTGQYCPRWSNLEKLCQVMVPGPSEKPSIETKIDWSIPIPGTPQ